MKLIFTPISLITGLLAGLVASKIFDALWGRFADEEAPEPDQRRVSWPALVLAMLAEGAIFRATRGVVDRGTRVAVYRFTGTWPGEDAPDKT